MKFAPSIMAGVGFPLRGRHGSAPITVPGPQRTRVRGPRASSPGLALRFGVSRAISALLASWCWRAGATGHLLCSYALAGKQGRGRRCLASVTMAMWWISGK